MDNEHKQAQPTATGNSMPRRPLLRVAGLPSPVAFCGYAGAGKTRAAALLRQLGATRLPFAGALKSMLHGLGLTPSQTDGHLKEEPTEVLCGQTPRYAMQTLGEEWGRKMVNPDLWANVWKYRAQQLHDMNQPVVVDDLRFRNEAKAVLDLGGIIIYISRAGCVQGTHPSELLASSLPRDFTILNDSNQEELYDTLGGILELCARTSNDSSRE